MVWSGVNTTLYNTPYFVLNPYPYLPTLPYRIWAVYVQKI